MNENKKNLVEVVNKELNNKKENIEILKSVNLKDLYSRKCPYTCDCAWDSTCSCDDNYSPHPQCNPYKGCGMR